jgi:hypothetical protein
VGGARKVAHGADTSCDAVTAASARGFDDARLRSVGEKVARVRQLARGEDVVLRNRKTRAGEQSVHLRLVCGALNRLWIVERHGLASDARDGLAESNLKVIRRHVDDLRSELVGGLCPKRTRDPAPTARGQPRQPAVPSPGTEGVDETGRTGKIEARRNPSPNPGRFSRQAGFEDACAADALGR